MNRWYLVSIQATLFFPCAVIIAWGRRDNDFQQWRAIPVDTLDRAQDMASRIVKNPHSAPRNQAFRELLQV